MGNVLSAGIGQAPARQAAIYAGIPNTRPGDDREQGVRLGPAGRHLRREDDRRSATPTSWSPAAWSRCRTCPTTSRRRAPGYRMGDGKLVDGMIFDGLWDPYANVHMGTCGDKCAAEYKFSREAAGRVREGELPPRARRAEGGPLRRRDRAGERPAEEGRPARREGRRGPAQGRPDEVRGAQARVREGRDHHRGQRVVASTTARARSSSRARRPSRSTSSSRSRASSATAARRRRPSGSRRRRRRRSTRRSRSSALKKDQIDLYEINEAFAVVTMVVQHSSAGSTRRRSTCAAARSRSATRSARAARAS